MDCPLDVARRRRRPACPRRRAGCPRLDVNRCRANAAIEDQKASAPCACCRRPMPAAAAVPSAAPMACGIARPAMIILPTCLIAASTPLPKIKRRGHCDGCRRPMQAAARCDDCRVMGLWLCDGCHATLATLAAARAAGAAGL